MADQNSRSRSQIEADLAAARTRLSANLEQMIDLAHPTNVKRRQIEEFKTFAQGEFDNAKSQFKTRAGQWRLDRVAAIGGAVVGFVVFVVVVRGIVRKSKQDGES